MDSRYKSYIILFTVCIVLGFLGCDSNNYESVEYNIVGEVENCPQDPVTTQGSFFPVKMDYDREFSYVHYPWYHVTTDHGRYKHTGTLNLQVESIGKCINDEKVVIQMRESFEGVSELIMFTDDDPEWKFVDSVSHVRSMYFDLYADSLVMGEYTNGNGIPWIDVNEVTDSISVTT